MGRIKRRYKNVNRYILEGAIGEFASGLAPGAVVIDVGAGSGHYRGLFPGMRYVAVDMGLEQKSRKGLDVAADVRALPFGDACADAAVCIEVMEHVFDAGALLAEIKRVLRPGGRLLLTTPLCLGEHMQPYDYFRYTRYGLEKTVSASGLQLVKVEPRGGYFVFLAFHLRKFPEYLSSSSRRPGMAGKALKRLLNPVFTYLIPFVLLRFDRLDARKETTIGFVCLVEKTR
ncbi:MAG: class I SAM-dependent methyltransferase [Deltaproteobacteria bacterium]|nr:class I SAM-dependent methyltransferase [Deltaproteobacteria bacterium]